MSESSPEIKNRRQRRWTRGGFALVLLAALFAIIIWPTYAGQARTVKESVPGEKFSIVADSSKPAEPRDPVTAYAEGVLAEMTLEQKIRSLLILHHPGTDPSVLQSFMGAHTPGGFILMGNNVPASPEELLALTAVLTLDPELPALVAIDEEGGFVTRLPYDGFAGANTLRSEDPSATLAAFTGRAALLKSVGVNVNFGIDADVTGDPQSFIFDRTFGDTPDQSAVRVAAAVEGEQSVVASTVKHFPGHGNTVGDSHISIPSTAMSLDQWWATDAVPFVAGIEAGAELVMFGHLAFTSVDPAPASLSSAWHKILREDLGFTGISITDDMTMLQGSGLPEFSDPVENAISAMAAGNDILLYVLAADPSLDGIDPAALVSGLVAAVESGRIDESQVDASTLRVLTLRRSFALNALTWVQPCTSPCLGLLDAPSGS
jgi:beta-N-acetylhexosaminidase